MKRIDYFFGQVVSGRIVAEGLGKAPRGALDPNWLKPEWLKQAWDMAHAMEKISDGDDDEKLYQEIERNRNRPIKPPHAL